MYIQGAKTGGLKTEVGGAFNQLKPRPKDSGWSVVTSNPQMSLMEPSPARHDNVPGPPPPPIGTNLEVVDDDLFQ